MPRLNTARRRERSRRNRWHSERNERHRARRRGLDIDDLHARRREAARRDPSTTT